MTTMPEANAKFALDLFRCMGDHHPCDNILISPANVTTALGALAMGSGCEQAAKIKKVLHWDELEDCARPRCGKYLRTARRFGKATFRLKAQEQTCSKQRSCPQKRTCRPKPCPQARTCRPEPTCPRPRPCRPEPTCPRPRPCRRESTCSESPCPERCVPEYECENPEGVHTEFGKILAALHAPSTNYILSFANRLYADHAVSLIQKFIYCALRLYRTEVVGTDFQNAPEEVRRNVNLWVEIRTHGEIMDLLPKDSIDCLTQLLHINALYYKGLWQVKFDECATEEATFYSHEENECDCPTVLLMNRKGIYNTGIVDICDVEVQVLEMPYLGNEMSLFVLLPTDCSPEALEQLEDSLSYEHLLDLSCDLQPTEVDVYIPKFKMERCVYAAEYLDLDDIHDPETADFSEITCTECVALTHLVHDTLFEMNEEGGEEPQAPRCPRRQRRDCGVDFVANHPFLFYVRHNCTESILVFGRFAKPE